MHMDNKYLRVLVILAALILGYRTFFTVSEAEFALVTQFGRPLYTAGGAGLHMKWAFQSATYFDRRLRIYNPRPSEFLTRDKKNIVVDSYVAWKIQDPDRFLETVGDPIAAEMRLHDIVWSGLSAGVGAPVLAALVSVSGVQTNDLLADLSASTGPATLNQKGSDDQHTPTKPLKFPDQNKQ